MGDLSRFTTVYHGATLYHGYPACTLYHGYHMHRAELKIYQLVCYYLLQNIEYNIVIALSQQANKQAIVVESLAVTPGLILGEVFFLCGYLRGLRPIILQGIIGFFMV